MAIPPQKFREIVFQILYSYDIAGVASESILPLLMKELAVSKKNILAAKERADAILEKRPEIDALISRVSQSYAFSRIQSVERNALRLGVFELLFEREVPPKVVIAEAMRICRKFTSPEAARFVNAILDVLYQESLGKVDEEARQLREAGAALEESEKREREVAEMRRDDGSQDEL